MKHLHTLANAFPEFNHEERKTKRMGKELATQSTSRYVQALYNINTGGGSSLDGRDLLKLSKDDGYWSFGQEGTPIDEREDIFVINPESFREGYVAFDEKANDLAETEHGDLADFLWQLGSAPSLEDHEYDHPLPQPTRKGAKPLRYQFQLAVDLVCIEGPNKGAQLVYKNGSQGARDMLGKLAGEIARREENGDPAYVPEIALYAEDYTHKTYGRIWKPKAEILGWRTMDDDTVFEVEEQPEEDVKEDAREARKSNGRTAAKADSDDRRSARGKDEDDRGSRSRPARGERDREVEEDRDEAPEEPAADEGRRERRGGTRRDRDEAERETRPARGEGRRERPARDDDRGERAERRPARGERRERRR